MSISPPKNCHAVNAFTVEQMGRLGKCGRCQTALYVPRPDEVSPTTRYGRPISPGHGIVKWVVLAAGGLFLLLVLSCGAIGGYFLISHWWRPTEPGPPDLKTLIAAAELVKPTASATVTQEGTLDKAKSERMFKFRAPADGTMAVAIDLGDGTKVDGQLVAFDAQPKELIRNDAEPDKRIGQILFPVAADKEYFVKVAGFDAVTGKFKLAFTHLSSVGNGFANAFEMRLSRLGSASQSWRLDPAGDEDMFRLVAPVTGWMVVDMAKGTDSKLAGAMEAYDSGQALLDADDGTLIFRAEAGKTYYVKAMARFTPPAGLTRTGAYTLKFHTEKAPPDDYGNDFKSAHVLTVAAVGDTAVTGRIEVPEDVDCFRFQAPKSGDVTAELFPTANSKLHAGITVFNDAEQQVGLNLLVSTKFYVTAGQSYYLKVMPSPFAVPGKQKTGGYTLKLRLHALNEAKEVTLNALGTAEVQGQINKASDVGLYRISATKTGRLDLSLLNVPGSILDAGLYIYEGSLTNPPLINNGDIFASVFTTAGKTYFIKVAPLAQPLAGKATVGGYTLKFRSEATGFGNAQELFLNAVGSAEVSGQLNKAGDAVLYRFQATKTGKTQLFLDTPPGSLLDAGIHAYEGSTVNPPIAPMGTIYSIPTTAGKSYYVKVSAWSPPLKNKLVTGSYTLKIRPEVGGAAKAGNTREVFLTASGSGVVSDQIANATEMGVFRVVAPKTGIMNVDLIRPAGSQLEAGIHMFDAKQAPIGYGIGTAFADFDMIAGQTYYIKVIPSAALGAKKTGAYTLKFWMPKDQTQPESAKGNKDFKSAYLVAAPTGAETAPPAKVAGRINGAGDQEYYRFNAKATGDLTIILAPSAGSKLRGKLFVYDQDRNLVKDSGKDLGVSMRVAVQEGKLYYVKVAPTQDALPSEVAGSYTLELRAGLGNSSFRDPSQPRR